MSTRLIKSFILLVLLVPVLSYNSCDEPLKAADLADLADLNSTIGGNPLISLTIAEYSPGNDNGNLKALSLCLNKIIIRSTEPQFGEIHLDYKTGQERIIPSSGIFLEELQIPNGFYDRITFELADVCGTGRSLGLTNSSGTFETDEPVSLQFWGEVALEGTPRNLIFSIQPIVDNLIGVMSDTEVRAQAQASPGSYIF